MTKAASGIIMVINFIDTYRSCFNTFYDLRYFIRQLLFVSRKGLLRDWWNPETAKKFTEKAQCVVEQFGNFTAEQVGLNLNGINTQGENIADMGGLLPAYEGYGKI